MLYPLDFLILTLHWFPLFCLKMWLALSTQIDSNNSNYNNETRGEIFLVPAPCGSSTVRAFIQFCFHFTEHSLPAPFAWSIPHQSPTLWNLAASHPFPSHQLSLHDFPTVRSLPLNSPSHTTFCIIGSCFPLESLSPLTLKPLPPCFSPCLCSWSLSNLFGSKLFPGS